jgi:hypothetical protein
MYSEVQPVVGHLSLVGRKKERENRGAPGLSGHSVPPKPVVTHNT